MTKYLSNKFRLLSAFAIILVVYIHMFYTEGAQFPLLNGIEKFWGAGMCSVAVPLFYAISGYLFFIKVPNGIKSIADKIRKRVHTLLIPYIIANILTFLFYIALNLIALKISAIGNVVNFKIFDTIQQEGLWGTLGLVFINPPIAFQLWFIRDLMVIVILSPVIWKLLEFLSQIKIGKILYFLVFTTSFILGIRDGYFQAFAWFSLGGYLAISKIEPDKIISIPIGILFTIFYLGLSICGAISLIPFSLTALTPLVGVPSLWFLYDMISNRMEKSKFINWLASYTFFIYLVHEPLLNIFKKVPLLINHSEPMFIFCYLLIPPIFCIIAACVGGWLKRIIPNLYSVYTGGR